MIETSFGQIMTIPQVFPVYKREVQNNMYSPIPFFAARIILATITFVVYPCMMTMTIIWFLGLPVLGFGGFFSFLLILLLTGFVGCAMGLTIGALFPDPFTAINVN